MKIVVPAGHHVHELLGYRERADVMREPLAGLALGQVQPLLRTIVRVAGISQCDRTGVTISDVLHA